MTLCAVKIIYMAVYALSYFPICIIYIVISSLQLQSIYVRIELMDKAELKMEKLLVLAVIGMIVFANRLLYFCCSSRR